MTPSFGIRSLLFAGLAIVFSATSTGCAFEPSYPEGTIACSASQPKACPSGFQCVAGYCRSRVSQDAQALEDGPAKSRDALGADMSRGDGAIAVDLGPGSDARPIDSQPDVRPMDTGAIRDVRPTDLAPVVDSGGVDATLDVPLGGDATPDTNGPIPDANPIDAPPDVPSCIDTCNPGETRCTPTGGLQTCTLVSGCPTWGIPTICTGRQFCQGDPPTAGCACPGAPTGCENGAGSVCMGNTLRTCKVGPADGCVYEDTNIICPDGKPCLGSFPSAACTCPPPPAACAGGKGTYCESSGVVVTCGLDGNGCLTSTARTACATDKPCTGSFPSASCSCGPGPAECGGTTGTTCVAGGRIETCALSTAGCLAVASIADCPVGTTCQGAAPNAMCVCPATPPECSQGVGTSCDADGKLATCARDDNNCLVVTQRDTCPGVTSCQGSGPSASCACPPPPIQCPGAGKACINASTLIACSADPQGCVSGSPLTCSLPGQTCQGAFPDASCACTPNPDCPNGPGEFCLNATTTLTCKLNTAGCMTSSKHVCKPGDFCRDGICETAKSIGWYDDLNGKAEYASRTLVLIPIKVEFEAIVRGIGIITRSEGMAVVGLYDSTSAGVPSRPLLNAVELPLIAGRNEAVNLPKQVTLKPGVYWIATAYKASTIVAADIDATMECRILTEYSFGAPFPSPWVDPVIIRPSMCPVSNYYVLLSPP